MPSCRVRSASGFRRKSGSRMRNPKRLRKNIASTAGRSIATLRSITFIDWKQGRDSISHAMPRRFR